MTAVPVVRRGSASDRRRWIGRHGWTAGVWLLLVLVIAWYATLIPRFGTFEITSIAKNSLPLAYLAVAQAVIVIAGGIDLSVGAMMVLVNSTAAQLMQDQSLGVSLLIALGLVLTAAALNGSVGWIINVSKVPDIVVTLATSFVLSGLALLILPSPGGGTSPGFRTIFTGSASGIGRNFVPPLTMLIVPVAMVATWMRRSRTGLSLYATGSDRNAAYISGVNVRRAKIVAYAVGGAMAAMAGLATTAVTGSGEPRFSIGANATLRSVAAIVLGGIALAGGTGSAAGAAAAGMILFVLSPILTALGVDPNSAQVVQGVLIVLVMMMAGLLELRRRRSQ